MLFFQIYFKTKVVLVLSIIITYQYFQLTLKAWSKEIDGDVCRKSGFLPSLKCLSCRDLSQFNLSFLSDKCSSCCIEDERDSTANKVL